MSCCSPYISHVLLAVGCCGYIHTYTYTYSSLISLRKKSVRVFLTVVMHIHPTYFEGARLVLPWHISAVGRSSVLFAERSSFSLISCSTLSIFVTSTIFFCSDDTQIRTTEEQDYKRTVYLVDHNVTFIDVCFIFTIIYESIFLLGSLFFR